MTTQELWQAQDLDAPRVTPAYLRVHANASSRTAWRRNLVEYGASALCLGLAIWFLFDLNTNGWKRAAMGVMACSAVVYAWRWWRLATPVGTPADLGVMDTLHFHRRELERQHAAWRGNWRWSIPLFAPSIVLAMVGQYVETPSFQPGRWAVFVGMISAACVFAAGLCEYRARKLRQDIEALELLAR
jgi:hypothetical protein